MVACHAHFRYAIAEMLLYATLEMSSPATPRCRATAILIASAIRCRDATMPILRASHAIGVMRDTRRSHDVTARCTAR